MLFPTSLETLPWTHAMRPIPNVQAYLDAIAGIFAETESSILSVILFGSAAIGGFTGSVSDVDLIFVLADDTDRKDRGLLRNRILSLEVLHGLRAAPVRKGALKTIADGLTAHESSFFICTRSDLLSGTPGRILGLPPSQAFFVDRTVIPGILSCSTTLHGEDLPHLVHPPPVRRFDVFKALFALLCQAHLSLMLFPLLPDATRYAMETLKHSVRSCYFCYHARHASLEEEVGFFQERAGPRVALQQLLALRRDYRPSLAFALRCMPALIRLHWRTALDNRWDS